MPHWLIKTLGLLLGKKEGKCPNDPAKDLVVKYEALRRPGRNFQKWLDAQGIANPRRTVGVCHVCKAEHSIGYCPVCCHWFCETCNKKTFTRGAHAVKELLGGPVPGCCGPTFKNLIDQVLMEGPDAEPPVNMRCGPLGPDEEGFYLI